MRSERVWMVYKVCPYGSLMIAGKGWRECLKVLEESKKNWWVQMYMLVSPTGKTYKILSEKHRLSRVMDVKEYLNGRPK